MDSEPPDQPNRWMATTGSEPPHQSNGQTTMISVEQGFQKPQGYAGKGLEGQGQGMECLTPH